MVLAEEDINAIKVAFEPAFQKIDRHFLDVNHRLDKVEHRIDNLGNRFDNLENQFVEFKHDCNKRFIAIELRLDSVDYKVGQIGVFAPYENAYRLPGHDKKSS